MFRWHSILKHSKWSYSYDSGRKSKKTTKKWSISLYYWRQCKEAKYSKRTKYKSVNIRYFFYRYRLTMAFVFFPLNKIKHDKTKWFNKCDLRSFKESLSFNTSFSNCATISSSSVIRAFFLSRAVCAATRFFNFLSKIRTNSLNRRNGRDSHKENAPDKRRSEGIESRNWSTRTFDRRANLRRALSSAVKLSSLFLFRGCPSDVELLRASELSTASLSTVFDSILSKTLSQFTTPFLHNPTFNYGMSRKFWRKFHHNSKYGKVFPKIEWRRVT